MLSPAKNAQQTARLELYRGEGSSMDNALQFATLEVPISQNPTGDIELVLDLGNDGNLLASAGLKGQLDKQEFKIHLDDLPSGSEEPEPVLEDDRMSMDLDSPLSTEEDPFEFDLEEDLPKTDQEILDDDSLAADGLDEFFLDEEPEAGDVSTLLMESETDTPEDFSYTPPQEEDDLGDLSSFGDFEDLETPVSEDSLPQMDLEPHEDLIIPESPEDESFDLSSMDELEELEEISGGGLQDEKEPKPAFVTSPEGFSLTLGPEEEKEDDFGLSTPEASTGADDFSLGDMDFGGLDGDIDLDMNSESGDFTQDDFSLGAGSEEPELQETFEEEIPAVTASRGQKSKTGGIPVPEEPSREKSLSMDKLQLVFSLTALVLLLGIFLGLLFLNMTRMTLVPPVQSMILSGVSPQLAVSSPPVPLPSEIPPGKDDTQRRLISLEYFGTPFCYPQVPLLN